MRIGVVGRGTVGGALIGVFQHVHEVLVYDKYKDPDNTYEAKQTINTCDLAFLAVPTPSLPDGRCDTSAVEECAGWITAPMCIRSTVPPGTSDRLANTLNRQIGFSPEYLGESIGHPWYTDISCGFVIVGGPIGVRMLVAEAYRPWPHLRIQQTDSEPAELVKYMENAFLAAKVSFVNQFYDIANELAINWEEARRLWLEDSRIGRSHTMVTEERGYGGRCLPKDLAAIIACMRPFGGAPLLEAVQAYNNSVRKEVQP